MCVDTVRISPKIIGKEALKCYDVASKIYEEYFDKGIPLKTLAEHARVLEMYYDGELVEAN